MYLASSDSSQTTGSAMSSGWPICAGKRLAPRIISQGAQLSTIAAMVSAGLA